MSTPIEVRVVGSHRLAGIPTQKKLYSEMAWSYFEPDILQMQPNTMADFIGLPCGDFQLAVYLARQDGAICTPPEH